MTYTRVKTAFMTVLLLPLLSCATTSTMPDEERIARAIAVLDARVLDGGVSPAALLDDYAAIYDDHDKSPTALAGYADALRRAGQNKKALDIIRPSVADKDATTIDAPVFAAYMRLMLGAGYYADAEKRITTRLVRTQDIGQKAQLNHLLGVALAGQHRRAEAIQAFRRATHGWDGRPGVVEANLEKLGVSQDIKTGF